ncbi:uncharacterized protein LOC103663748 [Ursus maritimus]|uniref:Uncharacterized protein LOC103663748 n=1 Tax=Ursus maritimus TaxID=29073 RepID=A0A8M1F8W9_URSMA|nr:uncharacterized protein LOC103663748 [Ursus maritimus]
MSLCPLQEAEQELLARVQSTLGLVARGYSVALLLRGREAETPRLVPQLLQMLFEEALPRGGTDPVLITLSLVQLSHDRRTRDLLSPGTENLSVLDVSPLGLVVENASEVEVSDSRAASELYLQAAGGEGRDCPLLQVLAGKVIGEEVEGSLPWIVTRLLEGNNYSGLLLRLDPQGGSPSLLWAALLGAEGRRMQVKQVRPTLWDAVEEARARRAGLKSLRSGLLGDNLTESGLSQLGRALRELQVVKAWSQRPGSRMLERVKAEAVGLPELQVGLLVQPLRSPIDVWLPVLFAEHYVEALLSFTNLMIPRRLLTSHYVSGTVLCRPWEIPVLMEFTISGKKRDDQCSEGLINTGFYGASKLVLAREGRNVSWRKLIPERGGQEKVIDSTARHSPGFQGEPEVVGITASLGLGLHQNHPLRDSEEQAWQVPDVALQFFLAQARRKRLHEQHQIWIQEELKHLEQEEEVAGDQVKGLVAGKEACKERQRWSREQKVLRLQLEALQAEQDTAEQDLAALYDLHVQSARARTRHMLQVFRAWRSLWEEQAMTTEHHHRSLLAGVLQDNISLATQNQELQAQNQQLRQGAD